MCHQFFEQPIAEAFIRPCLPKAYDLRIAPNALAHGIPVEADADGNVVAVDYAGEGSVRELLHYMVVRTNTMNWFADRRHTIHPLD